MLLFIGLLTLSLGVSAQSKSGTVHVKKKAEMPCSTAWRIAFFDGQADVTFFPCPIFFAKLETPLTLRIYTPGRRALVYEGDNIDQGWDGRFQGTSRSVPGNRKYVWEVELLNGDSYSGTVLVKQVDSDQY